MANIVLVHGGGHGGWCWQRLAPLLREDGHQVYTPTLTGLGERSHLLNADIDLNTHIADVTALLEYEDLTDVILVGHSYGGMVITGVADRAVSRVGHLVFLDAAHPRSGESLVQTSPGLMDFARKSSRIVDGCELVMWPGPEVVEMMGVVDPNDAAWLLSKLTPHPWKCFAQPLQMLRESQVRKIPFTNINASWSMKVRPAESIRRAREGERVWEIDTGHDLMITEPGAVAAMLSRVASAS
jgi:pimeloyl-ACP methyl ester carboxylesterase